MCVYTHTDTERKQSPEYFEVFEKNTIFNEDPVVVVAAVIDIVLIAILILVIIDLWEMEFNNHG